jgi:hypothetical protein
MQRIKEVGIVSLAKIMGVIYAIFGLLMGLFIVVAKAVGIEASGEMGQLQAVGNFAVVIFPIIYGLIGALSGLATGFFFNLAVMWVGPLEVRIVQGQE